MGFIVLVESVCEWVYGIMCRIVRFVFCYKYGVWMYVCDVIWE